MNNVAKVGSSKILRKKRMASYTILYYVVLTIISLTILLPFLWLVSTSLERFRSYALPFPPRMFPKTVTLFNYEMAFANVPVWRYMKNTIFIVILSLGLNVFIATLSGYVFSKGQFKGKNFLLLLILSSMMIPMETKLLPMYTLVKDFGLSNSYLGVVLPGVLTCSMYIFFIKQYCDSLPNDLYEAGVIDGAGKFRIYWQIFLPLMGPVIATIVVLDVVAVWNDLLWPMIVLTDVELSTLQLGLVRYNTGANGTIHAGISTALSVVSVLPLALVFCFMQRYIVESIAATGIKQ